MGFVTDMESLAHKAEVELETILGKAPKVESVISTTLKIVGPILSGILAEVAPGEAATEAGKIITDAQEGVAAATVLTGVLGTTPSVGGVLSGVATNLGTLLTGAQIKDAGTISKITDVVKELQGLAPLFTAVAGAL